MRRSEPRLTFRGATRAEWLKLWALRSSKIVLAGLVATPPALGVLRALAIPANDHQQPDTGTGPAGMLESLSISALPVAFIAALIGLIAFTAERTDESGTATLLVAPRPKWLVWAKTLPVAAYAGLGTVCGLALAGPLVFIVWTARQAEVPRLGDLASICIGVLGGAIAFSLLGLAAGALLRTTFAAAASFALIIGLVPSLLGALGLGPLADLQPASAIQALTSRDPATPFQLAGVPASGLPWWGGVLVLVGWCSVALVAAALRLEQRPLTPVRHEHQTRRRTTKDRTGVARPTFTNICRAEFLKVRQAPATWWLLGLSCAGMLALSGLMALRLPLDPDPRSPYAATAQIQTALLAGVPLAQLLLALFGTTIFTSDHTTGVIRAALVTAPRRGRTHLAKLLTAAVCGGTAATAGVTVAALVAIPIAAQAGLHPDTGATLATGIRIVAVLTMITIVGAALGSLLTRPVAAAAAVLAILVILPSISGQLSPPARGTPAIWVLNTLDFLPAPNIAAATLQRNVQLPQWLLGNVLQLSPDQSLLVLACWSVLTVLIAQFAFAKRGM